jgi:DNA-binding winged helix-turn-helix (wHTH) protein
LNVPDKQTKPRPGTMADIVQGNLQFGPFELSSRERVLRRNGAVLPLGSRALDILICLAERPGEVIAKQELMDHVWPDVTVEEGSIRVHMAAIRKALGDGKFGSRYIATVRGRGYAFVGTVIALTGPASRLELLTPSHRTVIPRHRTRALGCVLFSRRPGPLLYDQPWGPVRRWR